MNNFRVRKSMFPIGKSSIKDFFNPKKIDCLQKSKSYLKRIFLIFVGLLVFTATKGQALSQYVFSASAGTYTAIAPAAATLSGGNADEGYYNNLNIGFTFNYCGTSYTTVSASTNGWMTFGQNITDAAYVNDLTSGGTRALVAPLWDDLSTTTFYYQTSGVSPNRVFTAQWSNIYWDFNATNPSFHFQVKLFEGTNIVQFIYQRVNNSFNNRSASIGVTNSSTGSGSFISLNNGTAAPTVNSTTETSTITTRLASGQTYTFTPAINYYSQGSLDPNLRTSWNTLRVGGGAQPPAAPNTFSTNNRCFVIQNGHTMATTASGWSVSGTNTKVQIESGGTLQANNTVLLSGTTAFQVDNGGTYIYNLNGGDLPVGTWSAGSTLTIGPAFAGSIGTGFNQSFSNFIMNSAGQTFTLGATLTVGNNLTITAGTIAGNSRTIDLTGDLSGAGNLSFTTGTLNIAGNNTLGGTFTCGTGTVNYNGTGTQTVAAFTTPFPYYNLTKSSTSTANLNGLTTVGGTFTLNGGTFACGNNNLVLNGTVTNTSGTFTVGTNTVTYGSGAAQTIIPITYSSLTKSGAGTASLSALTTIGATFTMSGGTFACGNNNLILNGAVTNTAGIFTVGTNTVTYGSAGAQTVIPITYNNLTKLGAGTASLSGTTTVGATFTMNGGTFACDNYDLVLNGTVTNTAGAFTVGTNTVTYGSTGAQTIIPITYSSLTKSGAGTASLSNNTTVGGTFTLTAGTFACGTNNLILNGPVTYTAGSLTVGANTVTYGSGGAQSVVPATYNNLTKSGAGSASLSASTTIGGTLTLTAGQFVVGGNTLILNGPAIGGTTTNLVANSTSSLIFGGTTAGISIPTHLTDLNTLNINNISGIALTTPLNINNLMLSAGILTTTGNLRVVSATGTVSAGSTTSYVNGSLSRVMSNGSNYGFPIGVNSVGCGFHPLTLKNITVTAGTEVKVTYACTGALTYDGTLDTPLLPINWYAQLVGGTFTSGDIDVAGSEILVSNTLAESALQAGVYTKIVSTPSAGAITTSGAKITSLNKYFGVGTPMSKTYYSYQSGNWNVATTWTTDPSGSLSVSPAVPVVGDMVVILNGRTVTSTNNGNIIDALTIEEGGILNLGATTGHNFGLVDGQGILKLQTGTFPGGTYTNFVSADGGTVEYLNPTTDIQLTQFTYNNLIVNLDISTRVLYTLSNMTINGDLTITQGNFRISDDNAAAARADLQIDILGDVTVSANGSFTVGTKRTNTTFLPATFDNSNGNTRPFSNGNDYPEEGTIAGAWVPRYYDIYHKVRIAGNFTNNGTVRFVSSAVTYPSFTTLTQESAATVIFTGATDNEVTCNGFTDFYNLILDKGADQTYILTVNSSRNDYFRLWGRNDMGGGGQTDVGNPELRKALWVKTGTLRLTGNTTIASMAEGGACAYQDGAAAGPNSDIYIPEKGAMIIDGPNVILLTTADSYQEVNYAWGFAAASNVYGVDLDGCSSFSIRGKVTLNDGYFSSRESGGIIFWPGANGTLIVNGGTLDAPQLRSADGTDALATFVMTGGNVQLRGQYANNVTGVSSLASLRTVPINFGARSGASLQGARGTFNMAEASNVFEMSGGTVSIYDICAGTDGYAIQVGANAGNITVTGGTFNLYTTTSTRHNILSNGPLYNLNISRLAGTGTVGVNNALSILNDLTLVSSSTLATSGSVNSNNNLSVGHDFIIAAGTTYTPGTNTTTFNGSGSQTFDIQGTITGNLNNLTLAGATSLTLNNPVATTPIDVNGNFTISSGCTLVDNSRILRLNGTTGTTISNSGTHFYTASSAGGIQLTGTAAQIITGDGAGKFNNLTLNKTGGSVTMTSAMTVAGELRLGGTAGASARLDIGLNNLYLTSTAEVYDDANAATYTQTGFSNNRMILTKGLMSDNGLSRGYSNSNVLLYPFGILNGATYYYLPAKIQFSAAPTGAGASYGVVTSRPVNSRHFLAQSTNSLACYWKTSSAGFVGVPVGTVKHTYYYNTAFVGGVNDAAYLSGVYNGGSTWTYLTDPNKVDKGNDFFIYDVADAADGDYTAGNLATFNAIPVLYSSSTPTFWDLASSWSTTCGGAGGAGVPSASTLVYIGDASHFHTITVRVNGAVSGGLSIAFGSTLDLGTFINHNFDAFPDRGVAGSGTLRIAASGYFPRGDFGDFIDVNGGTVEYYTSGADVTVPTTSDITALPLITYKNLKFSPQTGRTIILPATNLTVYGNMEVSGVGVTTGTEGVGTPTTTGRTYTINGNLIITSGLLEYRNNVAHSFKVMGNTSISSTGAFRVSTGGSLTNVLELYGSLSNLGALNLNNTGRVLTSFKGTSPATISGNGATYVFYNLVVDKGTNSTPVVSLQSNITTGFTNPFLTLLNGTFRVDGPTVTISTTSAFNIPSTACFSVNAGSATIGTNNDAGDVTLSGRLEVLGGTLNIGNAAGFNNDIEYASAGSPTIFVSGGTLNVRGQIRRNLSNTSGALTYTQIGGSVVIYGQNQAATRAKLEITNSNSAFTMSGSSNLTLLSAGGTTYSDLYLRPETFSVTGGTINLGNATSAAGLNFGIVSEVPIWILNVGTAAVNQTATLTIIPITVLNHLQILGNSVFNANGFNVTLGGNFTNNNSDASSGITVGGYRAGSTIQTTTFNGSGAQKITGSGANITNFANLVFSQSGTVSLDPSTSIRINKNLTLNSGTLNDGGNTISLVGNVDNSATHSSVSTSGGISFIGSLKQTISGGGTGVFGNIILNNILGVDLIDNITLNGQLNFLSNCIFYIDDYQLTFGTSATIAGSPSSSKMIMLNGVISDQGVKVLVGSGDTPGLTLPIGVAGKYTPVTFDFSANNISTGYINLRPVNDYHPTTGSTNANKLSYYWYVTTNNSFSSATYNVTMRFIYDQMDVGGNELTYLGQRYDNALNQWFHLGAIVSEPNTIELTGVTSNIDGEYTAGDDLNYVNLPTLYSRVASGNWNTIGTWSLVPGGSGASCGYTPNGHPVVIEGGQTVILASDGATAHSVNVMGVLDCGSTTYHDLGHVKGPGRIILTATGAGMFVFPGGEFDDFFLNSNSTLEFTGATDATLPLKPGNIYKPYNNVVFSGTGIKYMSAENMKVRKDLTISAATTLRNTLYNKNISILGNWIDQNGSGGFFPGTGIVSFDSTTLPIPLRAQTLSAVTTENFYSLKINNPSGLSITAGTAGVNVSKYLYLTLGNITTDNTHYLTLTNTSTAAVVGGSKFSFVNGPLRKSIISGQSFLFPVGSTTGSSRYGALTLLNTSQTISPSTWTATYFNSTPSNTSNLKPPLTSVSNNEYWVVGRPAGVVSANIRLRWDANSFPGVTGSTIQSMLRVAEYESGGSNKWFERSTSSGVSGSASSGTITTSTPVTNDDYVFTIGLSGVTATFVSPSTTYTICALSDAASIPITLTGTAPWSITYRTTGASTHNFTQNLIPSASYSIPLTGTNVGGYSATPYTVELLSVRDANFATLGYGVVGSTTVSLQVNEIYSPVITAPTFTVGTGEDRTFSTADHTSSGATYSWAWVPAAPSGGTFVAPTNTYSIRVNPITSTAGVYWLKATETIGSCTESYTQRIDVISVPQPVITDSPVKGKSVCQGSVVTYSTPIVGTHTYSWTIVGGTPASGTGSSITVTWGAPGTGVGSVTVDEYNGVSHGFASITSIDVYAPINIYSATSVTTSLCTGTAAYIDLSNSQWNVTYQLRDATTHANIAVSSSGIGAQLSISTGPINANTTFEVYASNLGCSATMTGTPTITVIALPVAPTALDQARCNGQTVADLVSTPPGGCATDWYSTATLGSALPTTNVLTATTYYGQSRNTTTTCVSATRTPVIVTLNPVPVFTVTQSTSSICEGDAYTLTTTFTSILNPYTIDIKLNGISVTTPAPSGQTINPYDYSPALVWSGSNPDMNCSYTVKVTDNNGCSSTSAPVVLTLWKRPQTGPDYHIPNNFGL